MNELRFATFTTHIVQRQNGKWYLLGVHDPTIALISGDKRIPTPSLNCTAVRLRTTLCLFLSAHSTTAHGPYS
jgi:hypothetical protein